MDYEDSLAIGVAPRHAFNVLSDLPAMGRLSPENTGGAWLGTTKAPHLGARFRGTNSRDGYDWWTIAKVTTYEPPSHFGFEVTWHRFAISRWEFCVEQTPGGCRVTEKWTDRRNKELRRNGDSAPFHRAEFTKESIRTTLKRLKQICESATNDVAP